MLRADKNVAQKLFSSEKHVFWPENQLFPGTFIWQPFIIEGISPKTEMNLNPPSNNIYRIIFLKKLLPFKSCSYFKYGIFLR